MFFANGFVETDRRGSAGYSEENDILRELLLEGDFASPRQLPPTPAKLFGEYFSTSIPASTPGLSKRSSQQVDVSFPQISFDNSPHFTRLQPLSSRSCASFSLPNQSPLPASVVNAIVSPPRVFVQEFARLPQPFFQDVSMDSDMRGRPEKSNVSFLTSSLPPGPLPMLSMPGLPKPSAVSRFLQSPQRQGVQHLGLQQVCTQSRKMSRARWWFTLQERWLLEVCSDARAVQVARWWPAVQHQWLHEERASEPTVPFTWRWQALRLLRVSQVGTALRVLLCSHQDGSRQLNVRWRLAPLALRHSIHSHVVPSFISVYAARPRPVADLAVASPPLLAPAVTCTQL